MFQSNTSIVRHFVQHVTNAQRIRLTTREGGGILTNIVLPGKKHSGSDNLTHP